MTPTLELTHICEHPSRDMLHGAGGIPLETQWAICYSQWVERTDQKNSKLGARPYNPGLPRVHGGITYNGGAPWSDGYDEAHMIRCAEETQARTRALRPTAKYLCLDHEPKGDDGKLDLLDPANVGRDEFAQTMSMLGKAGFDALWGFPRWSYELSIDKIACIQRLNLRRLILDCYWVQGWTARTYAYNMELMRRNVNILGYSTRDCIFNVRPFWEGSGKPMDAEAMGIQLGILSDLGFRTGWVWHEGTHLSKPDDEYGKHVTATATRLNAPEWKGALSKWAKPTVLTPERLRWMREGGGG